MKKTLGVLSADEAWHVRFGAVGQVDGVLLIETNAAIGHAHGP